jgi:hypothetical protein
MSDENSRDEVLKRMLKTPPKPFTPKAKKKTSPPKSKVKSDGEKTSR